MAEKRRKGGGGSGFRGALSKIWSLVTLLTLAGTILGWIQVNNINSVGDVWDYFHDWSEKVQKCGAPKAAWNCDLSVPKPDERAPRLPVDRTPNLSPGEVDPKAPTVNDPTSVFVAQLKNVRVSDNDMKKNESYRRSEWKHWIGEPCDTRKRVLRDQGIDVKVVERPRCQIVSGRWKDPYSNREFTDPTRLDIDHVIPLGYAARHGGQGWSAAKKEKFANDVTQLLAVDASENRSKSDKGPSEYLPPNKDFHCKYAKIWVSTARKYDVSVTATDMESLTRALKTC